MSSELLYALTPIIPRRNVDDASETTQTSVRPDLRLAPVLVRPRDDGAHRSELEFAMMEIPSPVARNSGLVNAPGSTATHAYTPQDPNISNPYRTHAHGYSGETSALGPLHNYTAPTLPMSLPARSYSAQPAPLGPTNVVVTPAAMFEQVSGFEPTLVPFPQEHVEASWLPQTVQTIGPVETPEPSPTPSASAVDGSPAQQPAFVQGSSKQRSVPTAAELRASMARFVAYQAPESFEDTHEEELLVLPDNVESDTGYESEGEHALKERPKRRNGSDKRVITIKHAMRLHMLLVMHVGEDRILPESHIEGQPLPAGLPVRFVWESTTHKSAHNRRMRARIIDDIQARRSMYPHVPSAEFDDRKMLEAVFQQAYSTFRTKWRSQRSTELAVLDKRRDNGKAAKSRRFVRKKAKLASRVEARKSLPNFSHPTFDAALTVDVMSSEESDVEQEHKAIPPETTVVHTNKNDILITRPPPWRSSRLKRFYALLDDSAMLLPTSAARRPRGMGRKQRVHGPPREPRGTTGVCFPPKGVAAWMISEKWKDNTRLLHPSLDDMLKGILSKQGDVDVPLDWDKYTVLGESSEAE